MQTTAIRTVANSLPENEVILLTLLISPGCNEKTCYCLLHPASADLVAAGTQGSAPFVRSYDPSRWGDGILGQPFRFRLCGEGREQKANVKMRKTGFAFRPRK